MTTVAHELPKFFAQKAHEDQLREKGSSSAITISWESLEPGKRYCIPIAIGPEEAGLFPVRCPTLPGVASQGKNETEAIENLKEAFLAAISVYRSSSTDIPWQPMNKEMDEKLLWVPVDVE